MSAKFFYRSNTGFSSFPFMYSRPMEIVVFLLLHSRGDLSLPDLVDLTGRERSQLHRVLAQMCECGLVLRVSA
ncbi:helix-turn-helix domain-containing protein [Deinococcus arenae]|uniref:helix-turn-helix domain-containing protein n=1 Tax=Deinococcus arenae TaxID=1452751 RepID=UPI00166AD9D4